VSNFLRRLTFSLWYYFTPPWDSGISPPELLDFMEKQPSLPERGQASSGQARCAIDIGCGTGTNVITLTQAGWQVTGVDFIPRAIKIARRKAKRAGIAAELYVRDAANLENITGPFDLALDMGCFHGMGDKKTGYLSELERILAPGGHWLMYGFFNPAPASNLIGLVETDLELIPASMSLVWRQDGVDRGEHPSAWFLFQKSL